MKLGKITTFSRVRWETDSDTSNTILGMIGGPTKSKGLFYRFYLFSDMSEGPPYPSCSFDKILLDGPCSALGQRPAVKNKMSLNSLKSYSTYQRKLLKSVCLFNTNWDSLMKIYTQVPLHLQKVIQSKKAEFVSNEWHSP